MFFAERQVWKIPDVPDDTPTLPIKKVGVIGAGTMGGGIAMNFAQCRHSGDDRRDRSRTALDRGLAIIRRNYENTAKKGRLTQADVETRMGLLTPDLDLERSPTAISSSRRCSRTWTSRRRCFGKLDKIAKPGAILASNTSYLNVDEIAAVDRAVRTS